MLLHELVVRKMRIAGQHAIDLAHLPRTQLLLRIQAPSTGDETLPAENLVDTWNAPGELMPRVEERRIDVRELRADREQAQWILPRLAWFRPSGGRVTLSQKIDGTLRPHCPLPEQS